MPPGRSRNNYVFAMICGSGWSNSRPAKAARAELLVQSKYCQWCIYVCKGDSSAIPVFVSTIFGLALGWEGSKGKGLPDADSGSCSSLVLTPSSLIFLIVC